MSRIQQQKNYTKNQEKQFEWETTDTNTKMTQMLEFNAMDFKAAIIKILQVSAKK